MSSLARILIAALVACGCLLFARIQTQSPPKQNQPEKPAEITNVCSQKNPPPCATHPRAIYAPPPEYTTQARNAGYQGVCTLSVIVEPDGHASHIRVLTSLGMGLDEKAIAAVKRWKFAPALMDGKPVPVKIAVEIAFHLYAGH